ncbi:MAG TPA: hypothetical protein VM223_24455, partial [Planctomycetota bacterium]|nr:hypothetical protein [Planctomycetota bacterium]
SAGTVVTAPTFRPSSAITMTLQTQNFTGADSAIEAVTGSMSQDGTAFVGFHVRPTYAQTNAASATDLLVSRKETSVGTGAQLLADFGTCSTAGDYTTHTSKFNVTNTGLVTTFGGRIHKRTAVTGASYDVLTTDEIVGVSYGGACAIQLMSATVAAGRVYVVKDESGAAGANNITISTEATETIDGAATAVISANYNSISLYSDGTNWFIF